MLATYDILLANLLKLQRHQRTRAAVCVSHVRVRRGGYFEDKEPEYGTERGENFERYGAPYRNIRPMQACTIVNSVKRRYIQPNYTCRKIFLPSFQQDSLEVFRLISFLSGLFLPFIRLPKDEEGGKLRLYWGRKMNKYSGSLQEDKTTPVRFYMSQKWQGHDHENKTIFFNVLKLSNILF